MKHSAGILMYRHKKGVIEVLLGHPGGPYWINKDKGVWSIPKGEFVPDEESAKQAAIREFKEETGFDIQNDIVYIGEFKFKQKIIYVWITEDDFDASIAKSNIFSMEWPPKSGKQEEFLEMDKAEWFTIENAKEKIHKGQLNVLKEVLLHLTEN